MVASSVEALFRAESLSARIEAACRAEPELGQLWRAEGAIMEAVGSVGLEGVRIDAQSLLPRIAFNNAAQDVEPWDAERALKLLRILKAPGNPVLDPITYIRRIERLSGSAGASDWMELEDFDQAEEGRGPRQPLVPDEELTGLMAAADPSDTPILGALRVVTAWRERSGRAEPLVERALFAAVEGALRGASAADPTWRSRRRGSSQVPDLREDIPLRGLSEGTHAEWVCLPALALTRTSFRLWDPSTHKGVQDLLEGLVGSLGIEMGRLFPLRDWLRRAREVGQGRTRRSRLADAAKAFQERPVMRATDLAEHLGVTATGATNLAVSLTDCGILGEITHRRFARIWATPEMARLLEPRAVAQRMRRVQDHTTGQGQSEPQRDPSLTRVLDGGDPGQVAQEWQAGKRRHKARLEVIFEELDAALLRADSLLGPR